MAEAENLEREIEQPNTPGTAYRPPPRTKEIVVSRHSTPGCLGGGGGGG